MVYSSTGTIPEGWDLRQGPEGTVLYRSWRSWAVLPLIAFTVFWDGFLAFVYVAMFRSPHHVPLVGILFPLLHVAVGLGLTYSIFTTLFNRTEVRITSGGVRVYQGPLPMWGNQTVSRGDIADILVRNRSGSRGSVSYSVMYVDRDRRERPLLASVSQSDQAEFIAGTIRQRLGLREPEHMDLDKV